MKLLEYLILAITGILQVNGQCVGREFHLNTAKNNCYYINKTGEFGWAEAKEICEAKKANLATPSNPEKYQDLIAYILSRHTTKYHKNIWIGLFRVDNGSPVNSENWFWVDGSDYRPDRTQWNQGEPGKMEMWARLRDGKLYATLNASDAEYFVCEKNPIFTSTESATAASVNTMKSVPNKVPVSSSAETTTASTHIFKSTTEADVSDRTTMTQDCDTGWHRVYAMKTCYFLGSSQQLTWQEVNGICEQNKAHMVCPSTLEKFDQLNSYLALIGRANSTVWMGLECTNDASGTCDEWGWVDGSSFDHQWQQWGDGEPGWGQRKACVRDGHWYATGDDSYTDYYICEKEQRSMSDVAELPEGEEKIDIPKCPSFSPLSISLLAVTVVCSTIMVLIILWMAKKWKPSMTDHHRTYSIYVADLDRDPSQAKIEEEFRHLENAYPIDESATGMAEGKTIIDLSLTPGLTNSEMMDAFLVDGFRNKNQFIVAKEPTKQSMNSFWRMIWKKEVQCVVMLSDETKAKNPYWPKEGVKQKYGKMTVELEKEENHLDYIYRCLKLQKSIDAGGEMLVVQFQVKMPFSIDKRSTNLAMRLLKVRNEIYKFVSPKCPPILVHCREDKEYAAIFLAMDWLLQQAKEKGVINPYECVKNYRIKKVFIKQLEHYEFLYKSVVTSCRLGNTRIPKELFHVDNKKFLLKNDHANKRDYQQKLLEECQESGENAHVSAELFLINIHVQPIEKEDYINRKHSASKCSFIVPQAPLVANVRNFWKTVMAYSCTVLVSLYPTEADVPCPDIRDDVGDGFPFETKNESVDDYEDDRFYHKKRVVIVSREKEERRLYHLKSRALAFSMNSGEIYQTFFAIYKFSVAKTFPGSPILVYGLDGQDLAGFYCAFSCIMYGLDRNQKIDIFEIVRLVAQQFPLFTMSLLQYHLLHELTSRHPIIGNPKDVHINQYLTNQNLTNVSEEYFEDSSFDTTEIRPDLNASLSSPSSADAIVENID